MIGSDARRARAPGTRPPLVELRGVTRVFGRGAGAVRALRGVDLWLDEGEFAAIMGASGSGKSTAMNLIGGLDTPSAGRIAFRGVDVSGLDRRGRALLRRRLIGFVFQGFHLLGRNSALENTELPLVYRELPRARRRVLARGALARVGLEGFEQRTPGELSGGEQQRVAIARAIVTAPALLLADEPTGNLDSRTSGEIMDLIASLNRDGMAVLMVTHDGEVASRAQRVIRFADGRVLHEGGEGCVA